MIFADLATIDMSIVTPVRFMFSWAAGDHRRAPALNP